MCELEQGRAGLGQGEAVRSQVLLDSPGKSPPLGTGVMMERKTVS